MPEGQQAQDNDQPADGEAATSFLDNLPDELRNDPSLADFKSGEDLAKSYVHARSMIGADPNSVIKLPGPDGDYSEVFNKLGRPESPDGYELPESEDVPINDSYKSGFLQKAHELGLTKNQVADLYKWNNEQVSSQLSEQQQASKQAEEQAIEQLKQDWGDAYDQNAQLAMNTLEQFGDENLTKWLDESGAGNNPALIKTFAEIGKAMSEDNAVDGDVQGFVMSPSEANAEIQRLYQDESFMKSYMDELDPNHRVTVERMQNLFKKAHG